jgi:hypothetical protein
MKVRRLTVVWGLAALVGAAAAFGASRTTVGKTVLLARRTRTAHCRLGANPDRRCSPGAYYSGLARAVLCSRGFHTSSIRDVPESEKHAVEIEYGLAPRGYGFTLEIDHIVSLELGGSNDISNLFPEKANAHPGFHTKDKLENKLHALVCSGRISLRTAQRQIASNWQRLYRRVFGSRPLRRLDVRARVPGQWKNCTAVNRRYPHGVGRKGAHDKTNGVPVTAFTHNTHLYDLAVSYNRGLDRDHDGIACEEP